MRRLVSLLMIGFVLCAGLPTKALASSAWPANSVGTDISAALMSAHVGFEPSGITWHEGRQSYFVVGDGGELAEITGAGTLENYWSPGYNLEGIAIPDNNGDTVYLLDENSTSVYGFSISTGTLNGDSWDFSTVDVDSSANSEFLNANNNLGLEGIEWVSDGSHPYGTTSMGGVFYVGWQYDGDIFAFSPDASGAVTFLAQISTTSGYTDLAGLDFDEDTGILYLDFDGLDLLEQYSLNGTLNASFTLPGTSQEGISVHTDCAAGLAEVAVADDSGLVMLYTGFPSTCIPVDEDGDGVLAWLDCDDADAAVNVEETYYQDADGDGFGSLSASITSCSMVAPAGYVSNSSDLYDNAKIEISRDGVDNDGDGIVDENNNLIENGVHVLYGTEDAKTSTSLVLARIVNSRVLVTYRDMSRYAYFVQLNGANCIVTPVSGSAYLMAGCGDRYLLMNGLTGAILNRSSYASRPDALSWAEALVAVL